MDRVVSPRPFTVDARVRCQVISREICGGQSGTVTGFSPSTSVFSCQYHSTGAVASFFCFNSTLTRSTRGRSLGTFKQRSARISWNIRQKCTITLVVFKGFKSDCSSVASKLLLLLLLLLLFCFFFFPFVVRGPRS